MLLVIGLPLVHTLAIRQDPARRSWLASPRLEHADVPAEPRWTLRGWMSGDFQRSADKWFSSVVEPRGYVVRVTNQLLYSVFAKSYMGDRSIVVGRDAELYQDAYIAAYCENDGPRAHVRPAVAELRGRLAREGRALVVLISPNKAEVLPERLPSGVCPPPRDPGARRRHFIAELREAEVPVIDGHAIAMAMKAEDPVPPFPRGGTHWSRLAGARVATLMMREITRAGIDAGGLEVKRVRWDARPEQSDADLASLLTVVVPPLDYHVGAAEIDCRPLAPRQRRNLLAVGGSFLYQVLDPIVDCRLFRRVEMYFYYDRRYERWPRHRNQHADLSIQGWRDKLAATDIVILELADNGIGRLTHFDRFLADALAALR
jgi:hypothetical protein